MEIFLISIHCFLKDFKENASSYYSLRIPMCLDWKQFCHHKWCQRTSSVVALIKTLRNSKTVSNVSNLKDFCCCTETMVKMNEIFLSFLYPSRVKTIIMNSMNVSLFILNTQLIPHINHIDIKHMNDTSTTPLAFSCKK